MKILLICLLLVPFFSSAQGFMALETLEMVPSSIANKVAEEVSMVRSIDLNGNGKRDYIVTTTTVDDRNYRFFEYWILDNLVVIWKKERYNTGEYFRRFLNLDDDPELEMLLAFGYEDGMDYAFYNFDFDNRTEELIFYFYPAIIENEAIYWGYTWDISDIYISDENDRIKILSSVHSNIGNDELGIDPLPENQSLMPVIFFGGHSTQPNDMSEKVGRRSWFTLEELNIQAHNKQ
ncbi:MAG: hypothetical protein JXQ90_10465 [Cyclobacteriaceae bacterium]